MDINVTIIDEYTGNILTETTMERFAGAWHADVTNDIVGTNLTLGDVPYKVTRQSTGISAYPSYEVYVREVKHRK